MWLLIFIVVILLLRAIATSKTAATVPMATKTVCSAPTAGDSFTQGNTIAAGVPEPPTLHCHHIVRTPINVYCGLPVHVTYPIAPPPIKITTPAPVYGYPKPAPMPVAPIARPIYTSYAPCCKPTRVTRCTYNPYGGQVGISCICTGPNPVGLACGGGGGCGREYHCNFSSY